MEKYVHFWKESVVPLEYFMKYLNEEKVMEAKEYKRECESNILEIISEGTHLLFVSTVSLSLSLSLSLSVQNQGPHVTIWSILKALCSPSCLHLSEIFLNGMKTFKQHS